MTPMELLQQFLTLPNQTMNYFISAAITVIISVLLFTYSFTTIRYFFQCHLLNRRFKGKEPATLPYFFPFIGSALHMIENPTDFLNQVLSKSVDSAPVRVRLGLIHAYIIHGNRNIQKVFRNSKDTTFEEFALRVAQKVKRLPKQDASSVGLDKSGSATVPLTNCSDDSRIWRKFHHIYEKNLIDNNMVCGLSSRFIGEFQDEIAQVATKEWSTSGIDALLRSIMFRASTRTLAGPGVFEVDPNFEEHFWDYDNSFMSLLYGLPKFCCRKGWDARDRTLETVKQFLARGWECIDWKTCHDENPEWERNFGSKLLREREEAMEKYGISLQGRASFQMGLIWSINSNAIPMASWVMIEILQRPSLYAEIQDELRQAVTIDPSSSRPKLNLQALLALPILSSVYQECLRLRSSIMVVREIRNDIDLDGYNLKAGNLLMAPSLLAHQDPLVWSVSEYPAYEFWPKRFCERKGNVAAGSYFPYGGGKAMCPGRYYAKQEILAAVALLLTSLDFDVLHFVNPDGSVSDRGPEVGNEMRGVARIDRDLLVKLRRRT